jgi:hypothetical protein
MNKTAALVICFFTGSIGLHFVYMGKYGEARMRLVWFLFCNPVAFIRSWIDFYKLYRMNNYQFKSHCMKRVRGTETAKGLKKFINDKF